MPLKYFKESEFACKCGCNQFKFDYHFGEALDEARKIARVSFIITSGYRCPTYNISVGGAKDSAHVYGKAADIAANNSSTRFRIIYGLIRAGFNRIGIGKNFIHADMDETKDEGVLWHYYE